MKKLLSLFVALIAATALWASNTITYTADQQLSGHEGSLNVGKTTFGSAITSHTFSNGTGTITCNGEITTIGRRAFLKCSGLTSVTIPNSVTEIGRQAFSYCRSLTSVTIPNSVTTIGDGAFYNCSGLTSVTIPNSVTTIGMIAFSDCSGLTSVTIGNSVTTIGQQAFSGCSGLTSVTIPNSVTTIGSYAFRECSGLTSITIPNSVTTIGSCAFAHCTGLTSITIGNSVTTIENYAFSGCSNLTSVTLNSNAICSKAYTSSSNIGTIFGSQVKEYIIGNSVTTIGSNAFDCSGLTSVTIPNSVTTIGDGAFSGCRGLTKTNYTGTIADWCKIKFGYSEANPMHYSHNFYVNDVEVKDLVIPEGVDTIGDRAFYYCSGLTSVTISNSVTMIGSDAFYDCSGLTSISVDAANLYYCSINGVLFNYAKDTLILYPIGNTRTTYTIPNSVTTIGERAFYNCKSLTSVTISNSVTTIGNYAFYNCSGLTSITIPNSVTTIGEYAFEYCRGLTSITIPNSVTTIGEGAFCDCSGLTSVTIGNSVTTIGQYAFWYCFGLTSITCYATNPPTCGSDCFINVDKSIPLYVPAQSIDAYKQAEEWKDFTNIQPVLWGDCGENLSWQYDKGVLTIEGSGDMYNYQSTTIPWIAYQSQINKVVFSQKMTSIGNYAFYGCNKITNLIFGSNLTTIGESAFANCNRIDTMTIYAVEPPIITETTFKNVSRYAFLYVPQSSERKYKTDAYWSYFDIQTISAKDTPISGDEVVVLPSTDNVTLTWPQNDQAAGYSIEITKDGVVFCTLKFNANGQLTGIAFAPSRDGEQRTMPAAEMTANGWQFTVTGLNQASKYGYTIDALNASQQPIKHYQGEFYTDGYTGLEDLTIDKQVGNKFIYGNQLYIRRGDKIYNAAGELIK